MNNNNTTHLQQQTQFICKSSASDCGHGGSLSAMWYAHSGYYRRQELTFQGCCYLILRDQDGPAAAQPQLLPRVLSSASHFLPVSLVSLLWLTIWGTTPYHRQMLEGIIMARPYPFHMNVFTRTKKDIAEYPDSMLLGNNQIHRNLKYI